MKTNMSILAKNENWQVNTGKEWKLTGQYREIMKTDGSILGNNENWQVNTGK